MYVKLFFLANLGRNEWLSLSAVNACSVQFLKLIRVFWDRYDKKAFAEASAPDRLREAK